MILVIIPTVSSEFLVVNPATLGIVAGIKTVSFSDFSVYPNFADFDTYVKFSPQKIEDGVYQDFPSVTVFRGQVAVYHQLYSIFNNTKQTLYLKARIGEIFELSDLSSLQIFWEGKDEKWNSVWAEGGRLLNPETLVLTLKPYSSTTITLRVTGLSDFPTSTTQISFPFLIHASFSPNF